MKMFLDIIVNTSLQYMVIALSMTSLFCDHKKKYRINFHPAFINMFIPFSLLMMLPLFILIIPSIFTGKEMAAKYAVPLVKIMFGGFVVAILAAILYAVYYTNQLEQRGYVACKGTPSGFTPGAGKSCKSL